MSASAAKNQLFVSRMRLSLGLTNPSVMLALVAGIPIGDATVPA